MIRAGAFIPTLVIVALGAGASLLLWQAMDSQQTRELERESSGTATGLARVIEARIEEQDLGPLRRWAWTVLPASASDGWHDKANLFLADRPEFSAIARVEDGRIADVAASDDGREILRALEPNAQLRELMLQPEAPSRPSEASVGPILLPDGRAVLALRVATPSSGKGARMTLAIFAPGISIQRTLEPRAPGFAIQVFCGAVQVYPSPEAALDASEDRSWAVEVARMSIGPEWTIKVHATDQLAAARRRAPTIALIAGLLISALIASLVHVSQTSRMQASALVATNADLQERILATSQDESEIRRLNEVLEARVAHRTAALEETISELETFNYSVSHDLRSPLGAILNFSAILAQDYGESLDANALEYLQRISSSATAVVSLMDGLLAFSRSGREEIRKTRVDVQRLVEGLRSEYLAEHGAGSSVFHIGELPPAFADASMLRFIFANLISNACKFVRPGETPDVEIGGKLDNGDVVYFVRDQGIGFDMRFAEKLFGVFERLHGTDVYEGHGVGLAIVARLVRRHGGRAWAEGALGKGSTFFIRLPLQVESEAGRGHRHL